MQHVMAAPSVDDYMHMVKNCVEHCIRGYMTRDETMDRLFRAGNIPQSITAAIWRTLEETNKEFFEGYYVRMEVMRQINIFNMLLKRQDGLMRNARRYMNAGSDDRMTQASPYYQNITGSNNGQLANFPAVVPNMTAMGLPQDSSPSYPFCLINGSSQTGNNFGILDSTISAPNSNLSCGFPGSNFMDQKYSCGLPSTFPVNGNISQLSPMMPDSSSTFPGYVNTQQLPMMHGNSSICPVNANIPQPLLSMHDSSLLTSSRNKIVDRYTYKPMLPLHAHRYSKTDIHSPMNPEDELQSTLTQQGYGGLATDNNSPSI